MLTFPCAVAIHNDAVTLSGTACSANMPRIYQLTILDVLLTGKHLLIWLLHDAVSDGLLALSDTMINYLLI
jgi:hypothetical protein